jgi:hypothetical protein
MTNNYTLQLSKAEAQLLAELLRDVESTMGITGTTPEPWLVCSMAAQQLQQQVNRAIQAI